MKRLMNPDGQDQHATGYSTKRHRGVREEPFIDYNRMVKNSESKIYSYWCDELQSEVVW